MWMNLQKPTREFSIKEKEKLALVDWALNSHYWEEYYEGYWKCKYCGDHWTNQMGISSESIPYLCLSNPLIKKLIKKEE